MRRRLVLFSLSMTRTESEVQDRDYPRSGPHRAVQLGDIAAERKRLCSQGSAIKVAGWVCQDGTPELIGAKPLKPNATLLAWQQDFHEV